MQKKRHSAVALSLGLGLALSACVNVPAPTTSDEVGERSGSHGNIPRAIQEPTRLITLQGAAKELPNGTLVNWNGVLLTIRDGGVLVPESLLKGNKVKVGIAGLGALWVEPGDLGKDALQIAADALFQDDSLFKDTPGPEGIAGAQGVQEARPPVTQRVISDPPRTDLPPLRQPDGGQLNPGEGLAWLLEQATGENAQTRFRDEPGGPGLLPSQLLTAFDLALVNTVNGQTSLSPENLAPGGATSNSPGAGAAPGSDSNALIGSNGSGLIANNAGTLISEQGGSLIANNAGALIGSNGSNFGNLNEALFNSNPGQSGGGLTGSLVSTAGGSLTGNNGASLITPKSATVVGFPYFPLSLPPAKRQLLQFALPLADPERVSPAGVRESLWPDSTRVRAVRADGTPLTEWRKTEPSGCFVLELPETVPVVFFLHAELRTFRPEDPLHHAFAMAIAPSDPTRPVAVLMDANTSITAGSTLHLLSYIPPEYQRLNNVTVSFESRVATLIEELRKVDKKPDSKESKQEAQQEANIESEINILESRMDLAADRLNELNQAWHAFNPLYYGTDYHKANVTITQPLAEAVSKAQNLRGTYDPLYGLKSGGKLDPSSFLAIPPDSPL